MTMKPLFAPLLSLLLILPALAQTDPGAQQDAQDERRKLLRAADQIETLQANLDAATVQLNTLKAGLEQNRTDLDAAKTDIAALKAANTALKSDNAALREAIEKLDAARAEERKLLLEQISKIVADSPKRVAPPNPTKEDKPVEPSPANASKGGTQQGFDYVVAKGDTLRAIAAAYAAHGVHVTVADLRDANNLAKTDAIHVGQKLFIPKK